MKNVSFELAQNLSKEIIKDLHPDDVYQIAENALVDNFMLCDFDSLKEEYEERYDYIF